MKYAQALAICGLVAVAAAAPWPSTVPMCAEECPVTELSKFKYATDKTYEYRYSGKSRVELKGVEGGVTEMPWEKTVLLSWLSPCEMAITFKDVKADGQSITDETAQFLTRYPLVVALTDGRVQQVCSHPYDDPWAINMKKGVATAFQNLLPSLSSLNSGFNFTETDLSGKCPTQYEVQNEGDKVVVTKSKNHRQCSQQYPTASETPKVWLKTPIPVEESWSTCKQEIENGIYRSISCKDKTVVRPSKGAFKYVEGIQESTLQYVSENDQAPESLSTIRGEYDYGKLLFDHRPPNKDRKLVPQLEERLKEVCTMTGESTQHETASVMAEVVELLKHVPGDALSQIASKIHLGQLCPDKNRVENLFLDAIAFTYDSNSVKIMVEKLMEGTSERRTALYAAALYNTYYPTAEAIGELQKLFEHDKQVSPVLLSAASMVHNFCRHKRDCERVSQVTAIINVLDSKLQSQCKPCDDDATKDGALATLEALGNIGVMTPEVTKTALKCIETKGVEDSIHIAAIRSFRNARCQRYATMNLVDIAVDPNMDTEVRIASYLVAVRCMEKPDMDKIFSKISNEDNTQVRSFVLSHMLNLQQTKNPEKKSLKYLVSDYVIPSNFSQDIRKYSSNIDSSFFDPTLGIGVEAESNIIYSPGSIIPSTALLNLTSMLYGESVNIGALGARLGGLERFIKKNFGPESIFGDTSSRTILQKINEFIQEKGSKVLEGIHKSIRERRSIDASTVADTLKKIYDESNPEVPRIELFANIMGQDIAYKILRGNLKDKVGDLLDAYVLKFKDAFAKLSDAEQDYIQMSKTTMDYSLPTSHGVPLRLRFDGTAIYRMKMESKMNLWHLLSNPASGQNIFKAVPSVSVAANGFVGYDSYITKTGLQFNNTLSSNSGMSLTIKKTESSTVEAYLDLPENMDLINFDSQTYLMKYVRGSSEQIILPSSLNDIRVRKQSCIREWESSLGVKICYDVDVPDIFRSTGLPLGAKSTVKLNIQRSDPSLTGYKLKAVAQNREGHREVTLNVDTKGLTTPRKIEVVMSYANDRDTHHIKATVEGPNLKSGIWINLKNERDNTDMQIYGEYKSSERTLSQGFKVERRGSSDDRGSSTNIQVYASKTKSFPPSSLIYSFNLLSKTSYSDFSIAVITKTHNAMREIVALSSELAVDFERPRIYRIPVMKKLRRCEFQMSSGSLQVSLFIRPNEEDSLMNTGLKITDREEEILVYQGTHTIEGEMKREFSLKNNIDLKLGSSGWKVDQGLFYTQAKTGIEIKITPSAGSSQETNLIATLENSDREHKVLLLVDFPSLARPIKIVAKLQPQTAVGTYTLDTSLLYGSDKALEISGPCTVALLPTHHTVKADLQIKVKDQEPFKLKTNVEFSESRIIFYFDFGNMRERLFLVEWKVGTKSLQETHMAIRFDLMDFLKHRLDIILKGGQVEIGFDTEISPESSSKRRITSDMTINYDEKKAKLEASWDAERDRSKRAVVEVQLDTAASRPGSTTIHFTVEHGGKTHKGKLTIDADYLIHPTHGKNGFNFQVEGDTSDQTLVIDVQSTLEREGPQTKFISWAAYKNMEHVGYKISYNQQSDQENIQINSAVVNIVPGRGESNFILDVHTNFEAPKKFRLDTKLAATVAGKPSVKLELSTVSKPNLFSLEVTSPTTTPPNLLDSKVAVYARNRGLKTLELSTDFTGMAQFAKAAKALIVNEHSSLPAMFEERERRAHYHLAYDHSETNKHTLMVQTPHRRMEAEGRTNYHGIKMNFYPNTERREDKYELRLTAGKRIEESPAKHQWEGRLSHPSYPRDKVATLELSSAGAGLQGRIEIDILPDAADKLTGSVTSTVVTAETVKMEARLSSRILPIEPVVKASVGYAPHTIGFDIAFKKSPSAPVSFQAVGKYDQSSDRNKALSLEVKSEGETVVDLKAVTKPQMQPQCYGTQIMAKAVISPIGKYNIQSKLCKPWYMEITTNKHDSEKMYTAKFGLQNPNKAEISLSVKDINTPEENEAILAKLMLSPPSMINLDMDYDSEEATTITNFLRQNTNEVISSLKSWMQRIKETLQDYARAKHIQFPSAEFTREWQSLTNDVKDIYNYVKDTKLQELSNKIKAFLNSPVVSYITNVYAGVYNRMAEIYRFLRVDMTTHMTQLIEVFNEAITPITRAIEESARMMKTREVPEFIQTLSHKIKESWLYQRIQSKLNEWEEEYPEKFQAMKEVWQKVKTSLLEDLEKLRQKLMAVKPIHHFIDWIINLRENQTISSVAESVTSRILQETIFVTITNLPSTIKVSIPIRERLYSLGQVMQEILPYPPNVLQNIIWSYDTYITLPVQRLIQILHRPSIFRLTEHLPPFNGTAMMIGNNEILTFDGAQFRIPKTSCEIRLLSVGKTSLTYQRKRNEEFPTVTLTYESIKAQVRPNFDAYLNSRKVNGISEQFGLEVEETPYDVIIRTPFLKLYIIKHTRIMHVELSGWTTGNVAGLLGTFDRERGNDWMMPTGALASNAQQFVTSWQEDHNCRTQELEPIHVPMSRIVTCHTLLGLRSRCNPLIDPKPYIEMCREAEHPCDSAMAYRHVCLHRGVLEPFPLPC